jgi:hypothetical protein
MLMVVVLYLLALAMIATGAAAAYFGLGLIAIERGWTMVICGTIGASAGALLVGVATAVSRLGHIGDEVARVRERLARLDTPFPAQTARKVSPALRAAPEPSVALSSIPPPVAPQPLRAPSPAGADAGEVPFAAVAASFAPGGAVSPPAAAREPEPTAGLQDLGAEPIAQPPPSPPATAMASALAARPFTDAVREALAVPPEPAAPPTPPTPPTSSEDDAATTMPPPVAEESVASFAEGGDVGGEHAPVPEEDAAPGAEEEAGPAEPSAEQSVVGSYSSGENSYVMYSDGSIQADTPAGRFSFASLDELKLFLASEAARGSSNPAA